MSRQCARRRTHRRYTQRIPSKRFRCVNIFPICILSGWNPVFTESCAANSSSLHPSIPPRSACYPARGWGEETARRRTLCIRVVRAYVSAWLYMRVCARTCVAFAPVILNVREGISILVGKHTNSTAVYVLSPASCAHTHVPLHIPTQSSGISRKGPRKMLSLRLLTGGTCRPKLSRDTNTIFQSVRKIRHFPYIRPARRIR